jgi:hypothetical protein
MAVLRRLPMTLLVGVCALWVVSAVAERAMTTKASSESPAVVQLAATQTAAPATPTTYTYWVKNLPWDQQIPKCGPGQYLDWHFVANKVAPGTPLGTLYAYNGASQGQGLVDGAAGYYTSSTGSSTQQWVIGTAPNIVLTSAKVVFTTPQSGVDIVLSGLQCSNTKYSTF